MLFGVGGLLLLFLTSLHCETKLWRMCALDQLKTSGTKIMMNGPIVRYANEEIDKSTNKQI